MAFERLTIFMFVPYIIFPGSNVGWRRTEYQPPIGSLSLDIHLCLLYSQVTLDLLNWGSYLSSNHFVQPLTFLSMMGTRSPSHHVEN